MPQPEEHENMSLPALRENLAGLEAWVESRAYVGFTAARKAEIVNLDMEIAYAAGSWEEIVRLRAERDNTLTLLSSFEETRASLSKAIDDLVEKEAESTSTKETNEN